MLIRAGSFSEFPRLEPLPSSSAFPGSGGPLANPLSALDRGSEKPFLLEDAAQLLSISTRADDSCAGGTRWACWQGPPLPPLCSLLQVHTHQILNRSSRWRWPWDGEALPTCKSNVSPCPSWVATQVGQGAGGSAEMV